ncbi:glycosyltransferase [Thioclava sp. JM3]|nr:glycosyltransferase [Thioclava sp. JM3]
MARVATTASGDIVHSDDLLAHQDVLSRVAGAFEDPQVEAAFSNPDYVSQADTTKVVRHWATGPYSAAKLRRGWMPAHPTLYLRRSVYVRLGGFDTSFRIAADYDFILRYFSQATSRSVYIPEVLYKMRLGGVSNRNLARIREKMGEDWRAIRGNKVGGVMTIVSKNFSKLGQFVERQKG